MLTVIGIRSSFVYHHLVVAILDGLHNKSETFARWVRSSQRLKPTASDALGKNGWAVCQAVGVLMAI